MGTEEDVKVIKEHVSKRIPRRKLGYMKKITVIK